MPYFCVEKIARALNGHAKAVNGSRIAIMGVSYKPGVGDVRESPGVKIVRLLVDRGADVAYHDDFVPAIPELGISSEPLDRALTGADCVASSPPTRAWRSSA